MIEEENNTPAAPTEINGILNRCTHLTNEFSVIDYKL
jgi:hypothetical protein